MNKNSYERLESEEEVKKLCLCEECGEDIFSDNNDIYIDNDNNVFCSLECALTFYGIHKPEDSILC